MAAKGSMAEVRGLLQEGVEEEAEEQHLETVDRKLLMLLEKRLKEQLLAEAGEEEEAVIWAARIQVQAAPLMEEAVEELLVQQCLVVAVLSLEEQAAEEEGRERMGCWVCWSEAFVMLAQVVASSRSEEGVPCRLFCADYLQSQAKGYPVLRESMEQTVLVV